MNECVVHYRNSTCLFQEDTTSNLGHEPVDHNQVTRSDLELATTFRVDRGAGEGGGGGRMHYNRS